jgi:L-asparaginase
MENTMSVKIIATGGTFDKRYDPLSGSLSFDRSHLDSVIKRSRIVPPPVIEVLMLMDSLEMNDQHRLAILNAVSASDETSIIIIHGTDTMVETATVLGQAPLNKTVILTGAMVPVDVVDSDADFNLGFALGCASRLPHGIYIAMNGRVHSWGTVIKNKALGIFESR